MLRIGRVKIDRLSVCLLCFFSVCTLSTLTYAQTVTVEALAPPKTAEPNDFITHTFLITNPGATAVFDLKLSLSAGLTSLGLPANVAVDSGKSEPVFVTILVSTTALAGPNEVTLSAISQTNPANQDSATAIINVIEVAAVSVLEPEEIRVQAGSQLDIDFVILNTGNNFNDFEVSVSSESQIEVTVTPQIISLLPGERAVLIVNLKVPEDILAQFVGITLKVTSTIFPDIRITLTEIIEILPPSSESFSTNLNLDVPLQLNAAIATLIDQGVPALIISANVNTKLRLPQGPRLDFSLRGIKSGNQDDQLQISVDIGFSDLLLSFEAGEGFVAALSLSPLSLRVILRDKSSEFRASLFTSAPNVSLGANFSLTNNSVGSRAKTSALLSFPMGIFTLQLNGSLIGPDPFDQGPNEETIGVKLRVSGLNLSVTTGFELEEQNRLGNLKFSRTSQLSSDLKTLLSFGKNLPTFTFALASKATKGEGPAGLFTINSDITSLSLTARQNFLSVLDIESTSISSFLINPTSKENITLHQTSLDLSLDLAVLIIRARFESVRNKDNNLNAIIDGTDSMSASLSIFETPVTLDFSVRSVNDTLINGAFQRHTTIIDLSLKFLVGGISFSTSAGFEFGETATLDKSFSLQFSSLFSFPTSIPAKGQVEGFLFVDENGNGRRDDGEIGVPKIILSIGGFRIITNGDGLGFFRSPPLEPGTYLLEIEGLPSNFLPDTSLPITITLEVGQRLQLNIPLNPVGTIEGIVFNDQNQNGHRDSDELGIAGVTVTISGLKTEPTRLRTNTTGSFRLGKLPAGEYVIRVDETTLPSRFELTTAGEISVALGIGEQRFLAFGAFQKPRTILFAPIADFSFAPARPKVGEAVTFDASASLDFDGEIVGYEWDFDNDGIKDAEGKVVTHVFEKSGQFLVTLTVIDNDGKIGVKGPVPVEVDDRK